MSHKHSSPSYLFFFFFNDTATTEIYTLSLHDALPICAAPHLAAAATLADRKPAFFMMSRWRVSSLARKSTKADRKSTRLNSSHLVISYAVFCLKKKKKKTDM